MLWKRLFATKTLEMLDAEAKGENRLRRVLGPIGLTSLGVGAIIGAGIFVMTGEVAANKAGPAILVSYLVAGITCAFAAFCYAEFASLAPVAGSAYTYAYATLGELLAWIIGWDLVLEYAVSAATVAASWSEYFNKLLEAIGLPEIPAKFSSDPFSQPGAFLNLPAVFILLACTYVLVIGIKESATSNTIMVLIKLGVVLFVVAIGIAFVDPTNWYTIPPEARRSPEQQNLLDATEEYTNAEADLWKSALSLAEWNALESAKVAIKDVRIEDGDGSLVLDSERLQEAADKRPERIKRIHKQALALLLVESANKTGNETLMKAVGSIHQQDLPKTPEDEKLARTVIGMTKKISAQKVLENWGMWNHLGINPAALQKVDDSVRSPFFPYGLSGVMLGASIVFFAFIGFDSISTHSEEAINPQRDVPIGIIASLVLCSVLYVAVSAIITGMVPYWNIEEKAPLASAFKGKSQVAEILIAIGGLAGMTSVLLITFLSQARIFLAMARDGLLPRSIFGAVHEKYRTPHRSTILTGLVMCLFAGFTPIGDLEKLVNIGTLFAFVVVCAAVLILRVKRPEAHRPFRCPMVWIVAPLGILANLLLMMFLPVATWWRLVIWLAIGLALYFSFGYRFSELRNRDIIPTTASGPAEE